MYHRSSKHNFSLTFYNLEREKKNKKRKSEECIEYYKKASDGEDCPLIFHSEQYYDKRFESETL